MVPVVVHARAQLVTHAEDLHGGSSPEAPAASAVRATLSFDGEDNYLASIIQNICVSPPPGLESLLFELVMLVVVVVAAAASSPPMCRRPSWC